MGNCQAAEAATVVIEHPGGGVERAYWSLPASQVMTSNPGHYVAHLIITNSSNSGGGAAAVKHLKLLRPTDILLIGQVYRLVSFEDVLKEFGSRKHVKLSRLFEKEKDARSGDGRKKKKERRRGGNQLPTRDINPPKNMTDWQQKQYENEESETEVLGFGSRGGILGSRSNVMVPGKQPQWRPTLQSIAEAGGQA